jgi:putative oxidoreductase
MKINQDFWTNTDIGLLIIRITFAVLLLFHGWHKVLHGLDASMVRLTDFTFLPGFLIYFTYVAEVMAPLLIIFGLFTRLAALSIFVTMTVVMYIVIATGVTFSAFGAPNIEPQIFYFLTSAGLFFTGSGRYRIPLPQSNHWIFE